MHFVMLPMRNLIRRPIRSGLTVSGIAVAIAAMVALIGLSQGLETAWTQGLMDRGTHVLVTSKGAVEILAATFDQELAGALTADPRVKQADGELINLLYVDPIPILVVGWRPDGFLWQGLRLAKGSLPKPGEGDQVIAGYQLAQQLGLEPGSTLEVRDQTFTVSGIAKPSGAMMGGTLTMPLESMQAMMELGGQITVINLQLADPSENEAVRQTLADLAARYPKLAFTETDQVSTSNRVMTVIRIAAVSISAVALIMGFFAVLNTLLMSIFERTWEIGVLSAVGWHTRRIVAMVVLEGLILAALGALIGLALGIAGLHWLATLKAVSGFLEPAVRPTLLVRIFLMALALGGLGGLYPAWWASRLKTVDALRHV